MNTSSAPSANDFRQYTLLEVWSPELAFDVLRRDLQVGAMVPTTVAIYELADAETAVIIHQAHAYAAADRGCESEHAALVDAADRETERLARIFTRLEHVPRREAAAHAA